MSNAIAIAAVTATLQALLKPVTGSLTARPLATARKGITTEQLNLCLYHVGIDAALRNNPDSLHQSPTRSPDGALILPLPLNLYYLITAFSDAGQNAEIVSHMLLGKAMAILHDHALLSSAEIKSATDGLGGLGGVLQPLLTSTLHLQVERVRITPQPLSDDEMTKLWTAAQAGYSPSFAYQVSVVLIESARQGTTPLPVLQRGAKDKGPVAVAGGLGPALLKITLPNQQSAAFADDILTLEGSGFFSDPGAVGPVRIRFAPARGGDAIDLDTGANSTPGKIEVTINPAILPADIYSVSVVVLRGEPGAERTWTSNALPVAIAPKIVQLKLDLPAFQPIAPDTILSVTRNALTKKVTVGLVCTPTVIVENIPAPGSGKRFRQSVRLVFANTTEVEPTIPPVVGETGTTGQPLLFTFPVADKEIDTSKDVDGNVKSLRLRVNGVELPTIVRGKDGLQFGTRVRILP